MVCVTQTRYVDFTTARVQTSPFVTNQLFFEIQNLWPFYPPLFKKASFFVYTNQCLYSRLVKHYEYKIFLKNFLEILKLSLQIHLKQELVHIACRQLVVVRIFIVILWWHIAMTTTTTTYDKHVFDMILKYWSEHCRISR